MTECVFKEILFKLQEEMDFLFLISRPRGLSGRSIRVFQQKRPFDLLSVRLTFS